jgi:hypothetical protein
MREWPADLAVGRPIGHHSSYRLVLFGNCAIFGGTGAGYLNGAAAVLAGKIWARGGQ